MEDLKGDSYETPWDLLRNEVQNYRSMIDAEFHRETGNTWPSCVLSRLTAMNAFIDMAEEDGEVTGEEFARFKAKIKDATSRAKEMQQKYTTVDAEIPSQEKEEMLSMLDLFTA